MSVTRRAFIAAAAAGGLVPELASGGQGASAATDQTPDAFPTQDPALVREMVGVSHGNVARVRELLSGRPALAKAAWDWGFGDWETALGAASHVGNRTIAAMLIEAGAPVTIFSAAMLDQLATVEACVAASPGVQRVKGPHGISLMAHARAGKAPAVTAFLESLGDADPRYRDEPIGDDDRAALAGTYRYGPAAGQTLTASVNARGGLAIARGDSPERHLLHLGGRVFHPPGAEHVRIRFPEGPRARELRVEDGPTVVVATRHQGA